MIAKNAENTALRFCSNSTSWAKAHANSLHSDHVIYICNNLAVSLCIITEAAMHREQLYRDNAVLLTYGYLIRLYAFLRMPYQNVWEHTRYRNMLVCLFAEMQISCEWRYNLYIKHVCNELYRARDKQEIALVGLCLCLYVCAHTCMFVHSSSCTDIDTRDAH